MVGNSVIKPMKVRQYCNYILRELLICSKAFLEMMINGLVEADEQSDNAIDVSFVPIFRR